VSPMGPRCGFVSWAIERSTRRTTWPLDGRIDGRPLSAFGRRAALSISKSLLGLLISSSFARSGPPALPMSADSCLGRKACCLTRAVSSSDGCRAFCAVESIAVAGGLCRPLAGRPGVELILHSA